MEQKKIYQYISSISHSTKSMQYALLLYRFSVLDNFALLAYKDKLIFINKLYDDILNYRHKYSLTYDSKYSNNDNFVSIIIDKILNVVTDNMLLEYFNTGDILHLVSSTKKVIEESKTELVGTECWYCKKNSCNEVVIENSRFLYCMVCEVYIIS